VPSDFRGGPHPPLPTFPGLLLEVLPDETLPRFGPGRAPDGNFVISEFDLKWAPGTNPPVTAAKLADVKADFSQKDFSASMLIDGVIEPGRNGWAIAGAPGVQRHVAAFKLEKPVGGTNGTTVRFKLWQRYADGFTLGRFRLYVTGDADPLDFGLPETVAQAVRAPAGERKPEQAAAIIDYYRASDTGFWKRKQAMATAREPLPADPRFAELRKALATAEEPIRLDSHLVQLREDTHMSARQRNDQRLTVVQDLAWALINSPAFLFNH
jgi:hypothetical protein